jgi:putative transposase
MSDKINVVKTYRDGNKGSKPMTPKQVALRVQAKAHELGDLKPANCMNLII